MHLGRRCEVVGNRSPMMELPEVEVDVVLGGGNYCVKAGCGVEDHDLTLEGRNQLERHQNRHRDGRRWGLWSESFVDCDSGGGC